MFLTPLSPLCTPCLRRRRKKTCFFLPCFFNKICKGTFLLRRQTAGEGHENRRLCCTMPRLFAAPVPQHKGRPRQIKCVRDVNFSSCAATEEGFLKIQFSQDAPLKPPSVCLRRSGLFLDALNYSQIQNHIHNHMLVPNEQTSKRGIRHGRGGGAMKSAPSPYCLEGCCQQAFDISREISNYERSRLAVVDARCLRGQGRKDETGSGCMKGSTSTKKVVITGHCIVFYLSWHRLPYITFQRRIT